MIEDFKNFSSLIRDDDPVKIIMVGETYCDKSYRIKREKSDIMALEYIISGTGVLEIDGQYLMPQQEDVFFLKPESKHEYYTNNDDPWHKYWIVFEGELADMMARLYLPENIYLFKHCGVKKHFERIFMLSKEDISYDKFVNAVTLELIQIFMYIKNRDEIENESPAKTIRKKLDESVERPFNLDRLCESVNYSKNYIINIFRKKYGVTPYQYYLERKIDAAKIYLTHTNMSISDIACTLCYADQQYFSTSFKKAVGCPPMEFRKKTRN